MDRTALYRALAIAGPTASGKTGLAIAVAGELGGEVISADSRQAYRGFRTGTAAPTAEEMSAVPHHGVGFLEPDERYGAGRFVELVDSVANRIAERGNVPIIAGGTGLFLRALTHPMFREPEVPAGVRDRVRAWIERAEDDDVARWAARLDRSPVAQDAQRAGRTVELVLLTGRPLSWWIEHGTPSRPPFDGLVFVVDIPTEDLRQRIHARAEAMLNGGAWEAEVRALVLAGHNRSRAFDALGYQDVLELVQGRIDREEALDRIFSRTWAYARRQRTWFRHQLPDGAIRLDGSLPTDHLSRLICDQWRATRGG